MTTDKPSDLTELLLAWNKGDRTALDRSYAFGVRRIPACGSKIPRSEDPAHSLQPIQDIRSARAR